MMFDFEKTFSKKPFLDRLEWMDYDTNIFKVPKIYKIATDLIFDYNRLSYSDFGGIERLNTLIIDYEKKLTGLDLIKEEPFSFVGSGVNNLISPVLYSILNFNKNKKEIIVFSPEYPLFISAAKKVGAKIRVIYSLRENDFLPTFNQIQESVNENTAAIIFSNPNNPTGKAFSEDWLTKLVELAKKRNFFILSDEIYMDYLYNQDKAIHIAKINNGYHNYVKFFGPSKDRPGMTGIRCGYCIGDKRLLSDIKEMQMVHNISNGIISDYLLLIDIAMRYKEKFGILHNDLKYFSKTEIKNYQTSIDYNKKLQRKLNQFIIQKIRKNSHIVDFIIPDGGNSIFFKYYKNLKGNEFVNEFIKKGLAIYPSEAFMLDREKNGSWGRICATRGRDYIDKMIGKI